MFNSFVSLQEGIELSQVLEVPRNLSTSNWGSIYGHPHIYLKIPHLLRKVSIPAISYNIRY